jgi:DNA-binding MarR family transcriptional regulator
MNQIAPPRRRPAAARNGRDAAGSLTAKDEPLRAQARQLDRFFKSLARQVLIDDDPAAELPLKQLRVCIALLERPCSMSHLGQELGVSQSAITQIADRLEAAGMVTRTPAGSDRRVRSLQLTARARKMLRMREESQVERVAMILKRMSAESRGALLASMQALRDACDEEDT